MENISLSLTHDLTEAQKHHFNKLVETDLTSSTLPTQLAESKTDVEVKDTPTPNKPKSSRRVNLPDAT